MNGVRESVSALLPATAGVTQSAEVAKAARVSSCFFIMPPVEVVLQIISGLFLLHEKAI